MYIVISYKQLLAIFAGVDLRGKCGVSDFTYPAVTIPHKI